MNKRHHMPARGNEFHLWVSVVYRLKREKIKYTCLPSEKDVAGEPLACLLKKSPSLQPVHMKLSDIKVMGEHRTNITSSFVRRTGHNLNWPRPIHVYLLRYTDTCCHWALKSNNFLGCQIYITDDVSKCVRGRRAQLCRQYLDIVTWMITRNEAMQILPLHPGLCQPKYYTN